MTKLSPTVQAIKDEVERKEWSVVDFAAKSGLSFQTVYRIFSGESIPNLAAVEKMVQAVGFKILVKK